MPKKKKDPPGPWIPGVRDRLQARVHQRPEPTGRRTGTRWREAESKAWQGTGASGASRPEDVNRQQQVHVFNNITHGNALKLASFEPLQHSTMVCGRPVQVRCAS